MGFHNFFGEILFWRRGVGSGKNPGPWISPGFPGFSLDFHWILTGFSVVAKHMVEIILLAQTFFSR